MTTLTRFSRQERPIKPARSIGKSNLGGNFLSFRCRHRNGNSGLLSGLRRNFIVGLLVAVGIFIAANLLAVHLRSDGGLFEGLDVVDHWNDDIRRIGFPFQFFEEGGFVHRRLFSPTALLLDALVLVGGSVALALAYTYLRARVWHEQV